MRKELLNDEERSESNTRMVPPSAHLQASRLSVRATVGNTYLDSILVSWHRTPKTLK